MAWYKGSSRSGNEYVDGIGWLPTVVVSTCLQAAGEEEADALHDASWEEFLACVAEHTH